LEHHPGAVDPGAMRSKKIKKYQLVTVAPPEKKYKISPEKCWLVPEDIIFLLKWSLFRVDIRENFRVVIHPSLIGFR